MSCTLPAGLHDSTSLWNFVKEKRCAAGDFPASRFNHADYYHPTQAKKGHLNVMASSFMTDDPMTFDPTFFNLTEIEATAMDPQHRLMLESAYTAIENAGLDINMISGRSDVGVFAAGSKAENELGSALDAFSGSRFMATGNAATMFSNRISYFFNLRGPSFVIDVACASSLTALHQAAESIRSGECSIAIVGGAFVQLSPLIYSHMAGIGALGKSGKSYSYDHRAEGYGRGEGVCTVVLRNLADAEAASDAIRAIVRGTAINHCGRSQGITMPSGEAQVELMRAVYKKAGIRPQDTVVVEGHGTGTPAGDPIEVRSISTAFGGDREFPLYLASIKANLGHLEAASGVLSVIKAVLMLERGEILPAANFEKPNPAMRIEEHNVIIPTEVTPWPANAAKRVSVNNFGFGGSNAHVIIEGYESPAGNTLNDTSGVHQISRLFPFSAKDAYASKQQLARLAEFLEALQLDDEAVENKYLHDLSYTLCCRRTHFDFRRAIVASTKEQLIQGLQKATAETRKKNLKQHPIFIFTGQGAQWAGMAKELMHFPVFAEHMRRAEEFLIGKLNATIILTQEIFDTEGSSKVGTAVISQPAVTAIQIALVELLRTLGVKPAAVCGHSSGEIGAAYAAGYLDFDSAMALAYYRGQVSMTTKTDGGDSVGAMMAIGCPAEDIEDLVEDCTHGRVVIACYNSPNSITASGDRTAIVALKEKLDAKGIFARLLKVDQAYHSHHMFGPGEKYMKLIRPILDNATAPELPEGPLSTLFFSSVTATQLPREKVAVPEYWVKNLISSVKFAGAVARANVEIASHINNGQTFTIEIGPHAALGGPLRDIFAAGGKADAKHYGTLQRGQNGLENITQLAASLIDQGFPVDVAEIGNTTTLASKRKLLQDLPPYQYNKAKRYCTTSRYLKNVLNGSGAWNPIIGHRVPYAVQDGRLECRHVFNLDDVPWLRDHNINGTIVFPMAGYISAVCEGLRLHRDTKRHPSAAVSYKVREMVIGKAWTLAEGQDNELYTMLDPKDAGSRANIGTAQFRFKIMSWNEDRGFIEHATGFAIATYESELDTISSAAVSMKQEWFRNLRNERDARRHNKIDHKAFYRQANKVGMCYGPAFQGITTLHTGTDHAFGIVSAIDTAGLMPDAFEPRPVIHPTLLDSCFQVGLCNTAGCEGRLARIKAFVPVFIEEIEIAADISQEPGEQVFVYDYDVKHDAMARSSQASSAIFAPERETPVINITAIRFVCVDESGMAETADVINPHKTEWVVPSEFITSERLDAMVATCDDFNVEHHKLATLDAVSIKYFKEALASIKEEPKEEHLVLMKKWMAKHVSEAGDVSAHLPAEGDETFRDLEWLNAIGPHLPAIFTGETHPLSVLNDAGLQTFYEESFYVSRAAAIASQLMGNLGLQKPSMRILEVGAGTGGFTSKVLEQLDGHFSTYVYTDISRSFLEPAKNKFSSTAAKMEFNSFDLDKDPEAQGYELGSFDVIIAADVIHATPSVSRSLKNIRALLKPDGVLALVELSNFAPLLFPFATLPGFWVRPTGPSLSEKEWRDELYEAGFAKDSGIARDWPTGETIHNMIWGQAVPIEAQKPAAKEISMVNNSTSVEKLTSAIAQQLDVASKSIVKLESLSTPETTTINLENTNVICVDDLTSSMLTDATALAYDGLKKLCGGTTGILWVVNSSTAGAEQEPLADFALGFARTIRLEYATIKFVVLHLVDATPEVVGHVTKEVYQHAFVDHPALGDSEIEFRWKQGKVEVPRLTPDLATKDFVDTSANPNRTTQQPLRQKEPLHATINQQGALDTIHFIPSNFSLDDPLAEDDVEVEICATGINFKDVLICLGRVPWQDIGLECAGIINATGTKAGQKFKKGDRVALTGSGGLFGSHTRANMESIAKIPEHISFGEAASIPLVFMTAYEGLVNVARTQPGEKVLIHAAAGGVGQAAIILCKHLGAEVYCTVGTQDKKELLMSQYGIPEERIFSSRTAEFANGLRTVIGGQEIDVVLNSLVGDLLQASWHCLKAGGRFIEIGKRDALANSRMDMAPFDRAVTFAAVDLSLIAKLWPARMCNLLHTVMQMFEEKKLTPVAPVTEYPIADMVKAFRLLQAGKHVGKVVITSDADAVVPVRVKARGQNPIRPDATYLITGGTGGLGRSITRRLIDQGATNIVLVSRRGNVQSADLDAVIEHGEMNDAKVFITKCDVVEEGQIQELVKTVKDQGMPPIRGVIHGAMFLKDALFEMQTYDEYQAIQQPKVKGAINLHRAFPGKNDLDFFICLASAAGVLGNMGQAPYAGGNTFLDSICRWRGSQGLCGASIDLPGISDAGYVAEAMSSGARTLTDKIYDNSLSESQFHIVMDAAMRNDCFGYEANGNSAAVGIIGSNKLWKAFGGGNAPLLAIVFSNDRSSAGETTNKNGDQVSVRFLLAQCENAEDREKVLTDSLTRKIADMMMIAVEELTPEREINDFGLDSLVAVELRNWMMREAGAAVPVMEIIACSTLKSLFDLVISRSSVLTLLKS
jgi:acyl transferase domain-containing protein/NADPH:quinone reductase-like Zn-dependent oxidoreductase/aryl carrier-like protein